MQTVFSLVFSAMVISNEHTYGPIGTIFALLSYLIAIGVVVILGAVAGRAWHERPPGTSETGQLPPCPAILSCHLMRVPRDPARAVRTTGQHELKAQRLVCSPHPRSPQMHLSRP